MRLEWIEDLLAVLKAGSLNRAAEQRYLTQPAFSRRIKVIEEYVGVELLDRTHKPAQFHKAVVDRQQRLEELAGSLRDLLYELRQQGTEAQNRIVVASQHAITTSIAPQLIRRLAEEFDIHIRLRSANRSECFAMLATRQADLMLTYRHAEEELPFHAPVFEDMELRSENFIPVYARSGMDRLNDTMRSGYLPIIAYPGDVFLGEVMNRHIVPLLREFTVVKTRAETALTLAALQLAREAVGVAWVPRSLATHDIAEGILTELDETFGRAGLLIGATRLSGPKSKSEDIAWDMVQALEGRSAVPVSDR